MPEDLVAKASIPINAPIAEVWNAFVDPQVIKQYMFGTTVVSTWKEGAAITWEGEWQGKPYEDKGVILQLKPQQTIQYSHFSPLSGLPDTPDSYHTVTIQLSRQGSQTLVTLSQDKNLTEQARDRSEELWRTMLAALKSLLEA